MPKDCPLSAAELCLAVCEFIKTERRVIVRDTLRIIPIETTTGITWDAFIHSSCLQFLHTLFDASPTTWKCDLNKRNNSVGSRTLLFDIAHALSLGVDVATVKEAAIADRQREREDAKKPPIVVAQSPVGKSTSEYDQQKEAEAHAAASEAETKKGVAIDSEEGVVSEDKMELAKLILPLLESASTGHRIIMDEPQLTIFYEFNQAFAGVGACTGFAANRKFNLFELQKEFVGDVASDAANDDAGDGGEKTEAAPAADPEGGVTSG
ncbi:hypothetical protein GNI_088960 [Gregarina niphandrodes]|uniref:Uncharacterized protein n=1 Tax=Gregarina niphandrodes TaxID=110365 RepID=A0A023B5N2_GRENI|nr:hypothetical protein GNI_088960 [Gregarina niphandrodes]EZG61396.1 hypothetical protein GNI_088960 [Gregarina niphandrodes]|eukprot:XP_011130756.1 hypothetical protein GNI_088960 [Gregarina niphandrodes]